MLRHMYRASGVLKNAVPVEFRGCYVGGACGEFSRIVNQIAACCDSNAIRVLLLQTICDDNFGIGWRLILGIFGASFGSMTKIASVPVVFVLSSP